MAVDGGLREERSVRGLSNKIESVRGCSEACGLHPFLWVWFSGFSRSKQPGCKGQVFEYAKIPGVLDLRITV